MSALASAAAPAADDVARASTDRERHERRLAFADAFRATAIFAVVLHHLFYMTRPAIGHGRPFELGYLGVWGVNCFFVLSGYLLGRPYIAALIRESPLPGAGLFLSRRFFRIYPLYVCSIVFSVAYLAIFARYHVPVADIAAHLTMLHTFAIGTAESINGPLWTMAVDAEYYIALPLGAALLALLLPKGELRRVAVLRWLLIAIIVASVAFRYVQLANHHEALRNFAAAIVYVRNLFGFAGTFALGMLLALFTLAPKKGVSRGPAFYVGLMIAGAVIALLQLTNRVDAATGSLSAIEFVRGTFNELGAALSASLILYGLAEGQLPWLERFAASPAIRTAAALSYAIYLFHWPIIDGVTVALHRPHGDLALFEVMAVSLLIIVPFAYALHRFIERPFLAIRNRLREDSPMERGTPSMPRRRT